MLAKQWATRLTHRVYTLPILVLMPHSQCNCRCIMCDIWKANHEKRHLSVQELEKHLDSIRSLGVRRVLLSGGEPLMHENLWTFCALLRRESIRITLLSTGILVEENAETIVRNCHQLIISLDGSPTVHDRIRRIAGCSTRLAAGVSAVKGQHRHFPVTARTVVQKLNCRDLPDTVSHAREIGLDGISFLAADVSTTAFNRPLPWDGSRVSEVALCSSDLPHLARGIEILLNDFHKEFAAGFILTPPGKIWDIYRYYKALLGQGEFPQVRCKAPWISSVVEADGTVRPCFFHRPFGNVRQENLASILNSPQAIRFRRQLNVSENPVCRKCVCSLNPGWRLQKENWGKR